MDCKRELNQSIKSTPGRHVCQAAVLPLHFLCFTIQPGFVRCPHFACSSAAGDPLCSNSQSLVPSSLIERTARPNSHLGCSHFRLLNFLLLTARIMKLLSANRATSTLKDINWEVKKLPASRVLRKRVVFETILKHVEDFAEADPAFARILLDTIFQLDKMQPKVDTISATSPAPWTHLANMNSSCGFPPVVCLKRSSSI
jgi:hypothetical protein